VRVRGERGEEFRGGGEVEREVRGEGENGGSPLRRVQEGGSEAGERRRSGG